MKAILALAAVFLAATTLPAQHARRAYPENDLLARPGIRITVGHSGADLNGTDNRVLQAAVDYVGQLGGGVVEIGPGEYLMRDSLHLRSGVTIRGSGKTTVLKKAPSKRSLLAADGDFGEEAITVADPDQFNIGDGVYIATKRVHGFHTICATVLNKRDNYVTLSRPLNADCMMADAAFAATVFPVISAYHVRDFRIEKLAIHGDRESNELIDGCRGAGIFFYQGDAGVIDGVIVRYYNGDGISFQQSNDVKVLNSIVENCAGGGIHPGSGSQRSVVADCLVRGNGRDGFFFCWRVRDAVVERNLFADNGGVGISIGHKDSDNLIRENTVKGNQSGGVHWRRETEPMSGHRNRLFGNTVLNNGRFQLFIDGETEGTVIRSNRIESAVAEIPAIRIGAGTRSVTIEKNQIKADRELVDERKQ
ncbi:MAG TPA: hypothetical protein DCY13_21245 [Verrucomicrobiales bacterium]|nr:hypothetical protein [Verrucomicrobiales bacterium]